MIVTLGTTNTGKIREMRAILEALGVGWTLAPRPEMGEIVEDGATFEANAILKAKAVQAVAGGYALADDSGLEVDALGGAPGVLSARYAGPGAGDEDNNRRLATEMAAVAPGERGGRFVAVLALVGPEGVIATARGTCEGEIVTTPQGNGGFGYDPYFIPKGYSRSLATLSPAEKNRISHRGQALRRLVEDLRERKERPTDFSIDVGGSDT